MLTIADQRVQVRVGNFAPANGSVDTYFDARTASATASRPRSPPAVAQGFATTPYQDLLPGAYHASFTTSGITNELIGSDLALVAGTSLSVFAAGINGQAAPNNLQLLAVRDDLRAPPAGMAKLRLLLLAPDLGGPVDLVTLDTSGTTPVITGRLIVNLAYTGASTYIAVAPALTVALVPSGAATPLLPTSAGTALNLTSGTITTLVASGCRHPSSGVCATATTPLQFVTLTD